MGGISVKETLHKILNNIPGFRSRKTWKMIIAGSYYLTSLIMLTQGIVSFIFMLSWPFVCFSLIGFIKQFKNLKKAMQAVNNERLQFNTAGIKFLIAIAVFIVSASIMGSQTNNTVNTSSNILTPTISSTPSATTVAIKPTLTVAPTQIPTSTPTPVPTPVPTPSPTPVPTPTPIQELNLVVRLESAQLEYNNSVGNEWSISGTVNGMQISTGKSIDIKCKPSDTINLSAQAVESDSIPDVGNGSASVQVSKLDLSQKNSFTISVIVTENRGRYSGHTAKWNFVFSINKK